MRQTPSEPERLLWQHLRCSQLGVAFRRQVVLAEGIVDFYAPAARLVVEVDGAHHVRQRGSDKRRDARLAALGLRVLRVEARLVLSALPVVAAAIADAVAAGR
jgi:very-short-patch-repair endonuclease